MCAGRQHIDRDIREIEIFMIERYQAATEYSSVRMEHLFSLVREQNAYAQSNS
jgi:hypothetical protein